MLVRLVASAFRKSILWPGKIRSAMLKDLFMQALSPRCAGVTLVIYKYLNFIKYAALRRCKGIA